MKHKRLDAGGATSDRVTSVWIRIKTMYFESTYQHISTGTSSGREAGQVSAHTKDGGDRTHTSIHSHQRRSHTRPACNQRQTLPTHGRTFIRSKSFRFKTVREREKKKNTIQKQNKTTSKHTTRRHFTLTDSEAGMRNSAQNPQTGCDTG